MGAGKTTFTRALAEGLGVRQPERVCSPTFNLCLIHDGPIPLIHVDLFRLGEPDGTGVPSPAFGALGLEDLLEHAHAASPVSPRGGVVVVEWAELWAERPAEILEIELVRPHGSADRRDLRARGQGAQHHGLLTQWTETAASGADTRSKGASTAD